tara:strand:- start:1002 stop:1373 length:372 start_codon:yes stop_codon:yes gene_type:complete
MAHFAKIENGLVTQIIVVNNDVVGTEFPDSEPIGQAFIASLGLDGEWKQTSFNSNFRKQYANNGYTYDATADQFVEDQPFPSWSLDANNDWQPPTPKPEGRYFWNEELLSWIQPETSVEPPTP